MRVIPFIQKGPVMCLQEEILTSKKHDGIQILSESISICVTETVKRGGTSSIRIRVLNKEATVTIDPDSCGVRSITVAKARKFGA